MTEQLEGAPLFVEPHPEEPRPARAVPDVSPDSDPYYGHLSKGQCALIRRAVKDGGEDEIDNQAAKYGVDRMYVVRAIERSKPVRKYTRKKKELIPDNLNIPDITDEQLLNEAGVEQVYSTNEVADFFDRSNQWLYWGLRSEGGKPPVFQHEDGTPIIPERVGDPSLGRRRFTLAIIKEILLSAYRRGNVTPEELKRVLKRIRIAEMGGNWKARENWTGRQLDRQMSSRPS